jgi:hypothetical protein
MHSSNLLEQSLVRPLAMLCRGGHNQANNTQGIPMSSRSTAVLLAGTAFLTLGSMPAAAIEPEAAADALAAALVEGSNVEATYESAELDGSDIIIKEFTVSRAAEKDTISFDEVIIEAPTEGETGLFQAPRITFTAGSLTGESNGSVGEATMTDVTVLDAKEQAGSGLGNNILFATAEATGLKIVPAGESAEVTAERVYMESGNVVDNVAQDSKGSVEGVTLPPEVFPETGFKPDAFGYDKIVFDVSWDGSRDLTAGTMTIRDFTINIVDGGELSMEGVIGELPDPRKLNDAGAASSVTKTQLHHLTIHYDDNSLAGRVLDFFAKQQGMARADYAKQMADALPFLLIVLNNQAFQNEVAAALGAFLRDPQSLTIEITPDTPVSGDDLIALSKTEPGTIPDRLNASVTANAPE